MLRLTCVCPPVSLQLIASGEPLPTEHPVTDKGSFSTVPAEMGSQMGCLSVYFATAYNVTDVLLLLAHA